MGVWMYEEAGDSVEEDSGQAAMVVGEGQAFCSVRCSTCPAMCGRRAPGSVHGVGAVSGRSGNLGTSLNLFPCVSSWLKLSLSTRALQF